MRGLVAAMSHHRPMTAAVAELPRVHGRHKNRALAAARRARAVELKSAGLTYEAIATKLGYANRGTVFRVVSEALKTQTVEAVEELRSLEVERLDKLQLALWPAAMAGDVPSVIAATRIIMARCHLLGLEGPGLLGVENPGSRTVVVPPVP